MARPGTWSATPATYTGPNKPESSLLGVQYIGDDDQESRGLTIPAANAGGEFAAHRRLALLQHPGRRDHHRQRPRGLGVGQRPRPRHAVHRVPDRQGRHAAAAAERHRSAPERADRAQDRVRPRRRPPLLRGRQRRPAAGRWQRRRARGHVHRSERARSSSPPARSCGAGAWARTFVHTYKDTYADPMVDTSDHGSSRRRPTCSPTAASCPARPGLLFDPVQPDPRRPRRRP